MSNNALLRAIDIDKSYAGVHALRSASFKLRAGEVHALIGENGAGKSTLIKIITGAVEPDAGEITMPQQQLVEIARALGAKAKVLIMDEPTASLSEEDTQNLFTVIRQLRSEGVGIIYISHRLE